MIAPASAPGRENWRDLILYKEGRQILLGNPVFRISRQARTRRWPPAHRNPPQFGRA
jgi:hypothetical protein